jgi:hypothetical protein
MAFGFGVPERIWKTDKKTINQTYLIYTHETTVSDTVLKIKERGVHPDVGIDYRKELALLFDGRQDVCPGDITFVAQPLGFNDIGRKRLDTFSEWEDSQSLAP